MPRHDGGVYFFPVKDFRFLLGLLRGWADLRRERDSVAILYWWKGHVYLFAKILRPPFVCVKEVSERAGRDRCVGVASPT